MITSGGKPMQPRTPLRTLVLRDGFGGLGETFLSAEIDTQGGLVVVAEETAPMCAAMNDELENQLWLSVEAAWKDELLLRLLAERFASVSELTAYLERCEIAFTARAA